MVQLGESGTINDPAEEMGPARGKANMVSITQMNDFYFVYAFLSSVPYVICNCSNVVPFPNQMEALENVGFESMHIYDEVGVPLRFR